jgi:hypothetical protein
MIKPGIGTDRYKIGMALENLGINDIDFEKEERDQFIVYKTDNIWFFVTKNEPKLAQLSFFYGFEEKVLGKVGVGDRLGDVKKHFGKCVINHKVHEPIDYPGIAFESEGGSKSENAIIECISVSEPYPYYDELPEHIKNNLPGTKRKLP